VEDREAEVVHNFVAVAVAVSIDLRAHREALHTEVKVSTHCTLDPNVVGYVPLAVVAMIQGPARHGRGAQEGAHELNQQMLGMLTVG
jgi:hypothetical protein